MNTKTKRNVIISIIAIVMITLVIIIVVNQQTQEPETTLDVLGSALSGGVGSPEIINSDGKGPEFKDLAELEDETPLIVTGKKTGEKNTIYEYVPGTEDINMIYTISEFQVDRVIKDETGNGISTGDTITIWENDGYDKESNKIYRIMDYEKMAESEKYLLFVRPSESSDDYIPMGVKFGQIPFKTKTKQAAGSSAEAEGHLGEIMKMKEDARQKYLSE